MPDLQRHFLQTRSDNRQGAKVFGVRFALNHLRRNARRFDSELRANPFFNVRRQMRKRANRAADFAGRNRFPRALQSGFVALHFRKPERPSHPETRRLGVNAVRSADLRRHFKFKRAAFQNCEQIVNFGEQQVARIAQQQRVRRVHDIARSQTVMHKSGGFADVFG